MYKRMVCKVFLSNFVAANHSYYINYNFLFYA